MRIEGSRFGVKTNKTIRRAGEGAKNQALSKAQEQAVKLSQKNHPQVELVNGKLMKSANNFEKVNKKERKRQLTEAMEDEDRYGVEEDEEYMDEEMQYQIQIVKDSMTAKQRRQQEEEDEEETKSESEDSQEDAQSTQSDWLEAGSEEEQSEIRQILYDLAHLQRTYAQVAQHEIPEEEEAKIKALQRRLDAYKPVFKNLEGNSNRIFRSFSLEKLSGFMNAQEFQRKYLQTGGKQGKFLLKSNKQSKSAKRDAAKHKASKRKELKQSIKHEATDY